jgi:hypothetical protein
MSFLTQHPSALSCPVPDTPVDDLGILSASPFCEATCEETRPITPIVKHISSLCLPHDQSEKELSELAPILNMDLDGNIIDSIPDIFEILFPDNILPFPIDEKLLSSLSGLYSSTKYKWKLDHARTEHVSNRTLRLQELDTQ